MPLEESQKLILRALFANRSPENYLAGGTVINQTKESPRVSRDLDFFHDVADIVADSASKDEQTLIHLGYTVDIKVRQPGYIRARVTTPGGEILKIEWAHDSCFRFFPVLPDKTVGYKLSHADTATNKILAAAGRMESRDYVDCLFLDQTYCSLGALVWAAAAKDSGLSPDLILELMQRNSRHSKEELETEVDWVVPFDPERMKERWLNACEEARKLIAWLPQEDYGCLYLNKAGKVVTPTPETIDKLVKHHASKGGAWPKMDRITKLEKPDGKDDPPR